MACLLFAMAAQAQPLADRSVTLEGETLHYSIRAFAPGAQVIDPATEPEPTTALNTAKLLSLYLTAGKVEDAALLSTAPRRRFEVLRDYKGAVGDEDFKQVYSQYFQPQNRLVAEVTMGPRSLLVWHLRENDRYAGQYYVQVEGKVFLDDVPSIERFRLRRILEAIRAGKVSIPPQ
ncbi:MAG: hypothetical protein JSS40_08065 [Proteobacteria bacterium]|nr:hypothetical protein [Pseudomonadota bacterium]